jgi:hypothetical protein
MAMRWSAVVLNRERWDVDDEAETLERRAKADLATIGFTEHISDALVDGGLGEIGVLWQEEKAGWEARVMPWEFVIALATRSERRSKGSRLLTIWRHARRHNQMGQANQWHGISDTLLFMDAVPKPLHPHLSFRIDQQLLGAAIRIDPSVVDNPTIEQFRQELVDQRPEILHVAAVEEYEAAEIRGNGFTFQPPKHGLCLALAGGGMETVANETIAGAIGAGPPRLVTFGSQRSARLAALAITIGEAQAAVGFQDDIDRESMRLFYAEFYRQWRSRRHAPHAALVQTRVMLRAKGVELHGAGLVLWSDRSLIDLDPALVQDEGIASFVGLSALSSGGSGTSTIGNGAVLSTPLVEVECEPLSRLNYSLLHNDGDLFKRFVLASPCAEAVVDVHVRVVLLAGGQELIWQELMTLSEVITDLRRRVKVPVLSSLGRLKESVRSTMLIEVTVGERQIYQSTHAVELLACDEWTDDDQDRKWLPSFVFPRDPALARIITQAQRPLCILADDPDASFDGYQGLGRRSGEDARTLTDLQVQAMWGVLAWEIGLAYVNPPPTYTVAAQRVRSPSTILEERSGTCIDLALLLASTWERIGLRPVILLLKGHALPGYWRSEKGWESFRRGELENVGRTASDQEVPMSAATAGWMVNDHQRVVGYMSAQELWPVEATCIPRRAGFITAVEEGMGALRLAADFDCLIDLSVARERGVLPLP